MQPRAEKPTEPSSPETEHGRQREEQCGRSQSSVVVEYFYLFTLTHAHALTHAR